MSLLWEVLDYVFTPFESKTFCVRFYHLGLWPRGLKISCEFRFQDFVLKQHMRGVENDNMSVLILALQQDAMMIIVRIIRIIMKVRRSLILVLYLFFFIGWLGVAFAPSLSLLCIGEQ